MLSKNNVDSRPISSVRSSLHAVRLISDLLLCSFYRHFRKHLTKIIAYNEKVWDNTFGFQRRKARRAQTDFHKADKVACTLRATER